MVSTFYFTVLFMIGNQNLFDQPTNKLNNNVIVVTCGGAVATAAVTL